MEMAGSLASSVTTYQNAGCRMQEDHCVMISYNNRIEYYNVKVLRKWWAANSHAAA